MLQGGHIKVLATLQVVGHPRDSKRIKGLQESGFEVSSVAFERPYHSGRPPSCPVTTLGRIENRNYAKRITQYLKALPKIRAEMRKNDIVYALGPDMAALSYIAGLGLSKPIVVEVGDTVPIQRKANFIGKLVRKIESLFMKNYRLLVVICPPFLNIYYRKWLKSDIEAMIIENKVEPDYIKFVTGTKIGTEQTDSKPTKIRPIRIGYFGLIREIWSYNVLKQLTLTYPGKFEIVFAGRIIDPPNLEQDVKNYSDLKYLGEYKSPDDLESIYDSIDLVWICYPELAADDWNLRWSRPNRFFEACFFKKPIIARAGADYANDVAKFGIGTLINVSEISEVVEHIGRLTELQINEWCVNYLQVPREFYTYTTENSELAAKITSIVRTLEN